MRSFVALAAAGASILLLAAVDGEAPLATADSSDQAAPVATKIHPPLVKASAIN